MVSDALASVRRLVLGVLRLIFQMTFLLVSELLPALFPGSTSLSASCSSCLTLVSFTPLCLTHLFFSLPFSPSLQLPGPLTPVS